MWDWNLDSWIIYEVNDKIIYEICKCKRDIFRDQFGTTNDTFEDARDYNSRGWGRFYVSFDRCAQVGGNNMFKMLWDTNFTYDSSMPIYENRPPSWPYTLDYKLFHDCMIPPCPTRSYPGLWEVPMVMWQDLNGGRCSMGDACSNPPTPDGVYKMLIKNFERHYTTNRLVKSDRLRRIV